MKFDILLLDCPWKFETYSDKGNGKAPPYHLLSLPDLYKLPIPDILEDNSIVFSWVTDPFLEIAFDIHKHWGLTYKTVGFYWIKTSIDGANYPIGTGYYTRANPEQCLIYTKGKGLKRKDNSVPKLIISPRKKHSRKPDESYERIDLLYPEAKKIEIFATRQMKGYTSLGYDIDGKDVFESIPEIASKEETITNKKIGKNLSTINTMIREII